MHVPMSHVAAPHVVDALGFLVGGYSISLALLSRMAIHRWEHEFVSAGLFFGGCILMLLHAEPFVGAHDVVVFYRVVAIILTFVIDLAITVWLVHEYLDYDPPGAMT